MDQDMFAGIRRALGRAGPLQSAPTPPRIDEPVVRLVHSDFGLPELFARMARQNQIDVEGVLVDELRGKLIAFLRSSGCRKLGLPVSPFLEKLGVPAALRQAGFDVSSGDELTLDATFDLDCGITDAYAGVAETGSIVIRATPGHGRSLSLAPPVHVAILQPKDFVADLLDLMARLDRDGQTSGTIIISGPSRTADIEMTLITGMHGPAVVKVFLLQ
jgi:L-lactate dehydrogenase complex protein LldG